MQKTFGLQRFFHDIRHRRQRYRQFIGITFTLLVTAAGDPQPGFLAAGAILILSGIGVRLWASGHIKKNKALATDGPYSFVRHPLYVGNILLGVGFALASGLWWSFLLLGLILVGFYPPAIRHEDEKLHRLFQGEWEKWRRETRALIPRLTAPGRNRRGHWSFRQSLRQNGEPLIALFLLLCLYYLYVRL